MKILKLREAVKKVDRHGFRSDDEDDSDSDSDMSDDSENMYGAEEGEDSDLDSDDAKRSKRARSHKAYLRGDMYDGEEGEHEMLMEDGEEMMSYGSMLESGEQYMWEEGESYTEFSGESVADSDKD